MTQTAEIICYSKTGQSRALADRIAVAMEGHLQIVTTRWYHWPFLSWLTAGRDGWREASAPLNEDVHMPSPDGLVVVVGPVWAGKPAAPVNTVVDALRTADTRVAAALTCADAKESTVPLDALETRLGRPLVAQLILSNKRADDLDAAVRLKAFALQCGVGSEWQG